MLNLTRWNNAKYELISPTYLRPKVHCINFSFRKASGIPFALVVGLQTGADTMEINVGSP